MNYKIALLLDENEEIASLENVCVVHIFEKNLDKWSLERQISICLCLDDVSLIRKQINDLSERIKDCNIIVGKSVTGLVFNIFNKNGFYIFETENYSQDLFDSMIEDIEGEKNLKVEVSIEPVETDIQGYYYFDLTEAMTQYPEFSSKKLLKSFLKEKPFIQLELVCAHIPPWIENDPCLSVKTKIIENKTQAVISKKGCNEL